MTPPKVASILFPFALLMACSLGTTPADTAVPATLPPIAAATATVLEPTATSAPTEPATVEVQVFFTDSNRYAIGTEPYEEAVIRTVPADANMPEAVLLEFFKGPTEEERARGLIAVTSGFTGLDHITIEDGVAHVYFTGGCASQGATYTIAQPTRANLLQFPEIQHVKIYDPNGETEVPTGQTDSIPFCLEP